MNKIMKKHYLKMGDDPKKQIDSVLVSKAHKRGGGGGGKAF